MGKEKVGKARKKKKPSIATMPWDTGPDTAAQRHLKITEPATYTDPETGEKKNPNGVKRARRLSWAEKYHRQGKLTDRQFMAGEALACAWERTQRTAPAIKKVQVDTTPRPDKHVSIMIDRISSYHQVARLAHSKYWSHIRHVVIDNRAIRAAPGVKSSRQADRYMERLALGLDDLADRIGV